MNNPATANKICNDCKNAVHPEASRCPYCTSWINRDLTSYLAFWVLVVVVIAGVLFAIPGAEVPVRVETGY